MKKIVVGVWKDKLSVGQATEMADGLASRFKDRRVPFVAGVAPPPLSTIPVVAELTAAPISVVYQDVHWPAETGSYIGTTSLKMLSEVGIKFCMVGHSERRRFFCETDDDVYRKLIGCIDSGIDPILCVGDSETDMAERERVLREQLRGSLGADGDKEPVDVQRIAIAYEPVWAISTWRDSRPLPTGAEASAMLDLVRELTWSATRADISGVPFLFGGSVNPGNADDYFAQHNVDGALVGGASLEIDSLTRIFESGMQAWRPE